MLNWPAEVELLRDLVAFPSVSGAESALGAHVAGHCRRWELDALCDETGVRVEIRGRHPGLTLAFVSHLDTVPPGEGWTRDPYDAAIENGRLHGRGSGDAKASVAAMLCAARDLAAEGGPARGRLLVLLGYGEETRDSTMSAAVAAAGGIDAAVIGEPTNLDLAVAQRGLLMVDLIAEGEQRHAGNADGAPNAIVRLARDLCRLDGLFAGRTHSLLGDPTASPTMLEAGIGRNVTPPRARALLDIRSTPCWTHTELVQRLRDAVESKTVVVSDRLVPCESPADSRIVAAALRVRAGARSYGSPTCSDWVFFGDRDAVKCGPGTSALSHTIDESVAIDEVVAARAFYADLAREYLA